MNKGLELVKMSLSPVEMLVFTRVSGQTWDFVAVREMAKNVVTIVRTTTVARDLVISRLEVWIGREVMPVLR